MDPTKKAKRISEFSKVLGYKNTTQNQFYIPAMNNQKFTF